MSIVTSGRDRPTGTHYYSSACVFEKRAMSLLFRHIHRWIILKKPIGPDILKA